MRLTLLRNSAYHEGRVTMDATEFDEAARFCFDELSMNVAYTPQFFYMFGWAYPPKKLFGLEPFTPEWTAALQQATDFHRPRAPERLARQIRLLRFG